MLFAEYPTSSGSDFANSTATAYADRWLVAVLVVRQIVVVVLVATARRIVADVVAQPTRIDGFVVVVVVIREGVLWKRLACCAQHLSHGWR